MSEISCCRYRLSRLGTIFKICHIWKFKLGFVMFSSCRIPMTFLFVNMPKGTGHY